MKLVVFDIDDTLTRTMDVDTECFVQTVRDLLEFDPLQMSWEDFPHVTDTAVLEVLYRRVLGRAPSSGDTEDFVDHFFDLLEERHRADPSRFSSVPGSRAVVETLIEGTDWDVALATGAWRRSAEFKLSAALLPLHHLPFATSDDHHTRAGIVETAMSRALERSEAGHYDRVVAVGDGRWDVTTAQALGLAFIGVGSADHLAEIGARVGVPDYTDAERFLGLLESAPVPG